MKLLYNDLELVSEITPQSLYKIRCSDFTIETYPIGQIDPGNKPFRANAILDFNKEINEDLSRSAIYVARGICMNDKQPYVISFGGLIGSFNTNNTEIKVDKDIQNIAYFYLLPDYQ